MTADTPSTEEYNYSAMLFWLFSLTACPMFQNILFYQMNCHHSGKTSNFKKFLDCQICHLIIRSGHMIQINNETNEQRKQ